ncbi:uncharacterized protein LOC131455178 [Solea solea]|uniref:uncharacterized protein LOC131455178 n=1 Tax=Solea solea TaxID=90069 RepID=UPI002729DD18|nr:uncharacterized protein LOC131455178 [Solea solea]
MSSKKRSVCSVLGCSKQGQTLHKLPTNEQTKAQWILFISDGNVPATFPKILHVCGNHFTEDCYTNFAQYKAGHSTTLRLKEGAVPTIHAGLPAAQDRFIHTGTQTEAPSVRTCATQLSIGTLKAHVHSQRTQTPVLSHETAGTQTTLPEYMFSSTPIKVPGFGPQKRARVESEEEEGFTSPESQVDPNDPTFTPGGSLTTHDSTMLTESAVYMDKKYIVFESCLRELFDTCPVCKRNCEVQQQQKGTYVAFHQTCPKCNYSRKWQSQPMIKNTPVGNVQLSAATYFTGASFIQLEKLCRALQLQISHYDTFRKHARKYLEPAIVHKWKSDQQVLFSTLKPGGESSSCRRHACRFSRALCKIWELFLDAHGQQQNFGPPASSEQ